jgi:transposase
MADCSEVFVGLDTSKLRNAVAIAEGGRNGEVRYLGEIENAEAATRKLVKKLAASHRRLTFCYEAGPTGYGLYRQIQALGHEGVVVAPSLIQKKPGDRVKTNRRDALNLAKLLRAGELTAVWVRVNGTRRCGIWCGHARLRSTTSNPNASRFCRCCAARPALSGQANLDQNSHEMAGGAEAGSPRTAIAFEEMLLAVRQAEERAIRLEQAIRAAVPEWSLSKVVTALMAVRGLDLISAVISWPRLATCRALPPRAN